MNKIIDEYKLIQKAKRAARRQKQRDTNLIRAKQMRAERLKTQFPHRKQKSNSQTQWFIGCSGWFYWHWKSIFYPAALQTNKWFTHYQKHFNTVELNAPFYAWPTVATVKTWLRQLKKESFLYTVKVSELITHIKSFKSTQTLIKDFGFIADVLGEHMGCLLYQFPPSFHYSKNRLNNIVKQLDRTKKNVLEFRHKSWWNKIVYTELKKHKIIFCSVSSPNLPDELIKTADDIYIRFHGKEKWYRYCYSKKELQTWLEKIMKEKPKNIWIYFNNDREGYAIKNAKMLLRLMKKRESSN